MIAAGELPKNWPPTYLEPRGWKGRLVASRTLELTWESEAPDAMAGGGLSMGDAFGWHEPGLPLGRRGRSRRPSTAGRRDGARVVLASDQAARLPSCLPRTVATVGRA